MIKVCFLGAGSTVFAKNVLGDCMLVDCLKDAHITLVDIDARRLKDSELMLRNLAKVLRAPVKIDAYLTEQAEAALAGADYAVNAIQVGGYEPSTKIDFDIPKRYGLRQTIGDTLGIGGIFRGLRSIPVMLDYCRIMERVCPEAWLLNYANPVAMLTNAVLRATDIRTVGLCHSVQICAPHLCRRLDLPDDNLRWVVAGVNHQGWLLSVSRKGEDLYPEIKRRAQMPAYRDKDAVRFEIMKHFGYYLTESSEHASEYVPWFIKSAYPDLVDRFHIPLDEYPRRCEQQIKEWQATREEIINGKSLNHERGCEYASYIFESIETGRPFTFGGNVLNTGLVTNLPANCCVEVMCVADRNGVTPTFVGDLPPQCAALNRTNINVQEMTVEAALTGNRDHIYQAALLDPHTAAELPIDKIVQMCNELIEAHRVYLPHFNEKPLQVPVTA